LNHTEQKNIQWKLQYVNTHTKDLGNELETEVERKGKLQNR